MRTVWALALADFRDRVRRRSFLAVLSIAAFLGLQAIQGKVEVSLGRFTGAPTSAWAGMLMTMVAATFLGLAGFWVVKGSIARDAATGVGQILAATPMSKLAYTLGKALSHFAVLAAMCGVLALAAFALLALSPAREPIEPLQVLLPILLLALPGLAVVASCAVLFETVPFLARGFGNFAWFFLWTLLLVATMESSGFDLFGISTGRAMLGEKVKTLDGEWSGSFVIGANRSEDRATETFRWERLPVTARLVGERAAAFGVAILLALSAALPFDRFDPARRRLRTRSKRAATAAGEEAKARAAAPARSLAPLGPQRATGIARLAVAETRLALRSMPRWWLLGAAILTVGGAVSPAGVREGWLAGAFLWPALLWSGLATRDRAYGVAPLLLAAPRPLGRQLPAVVLAGWAAGLACCGGAAVGRLVTGDVVGAFGTLAGCLAIVMLAVALGILSNGPRLFEGIYVALWYLGPLQRAWPVDFAAVSEPAARAGVPLWFVVLAAGLLAVAMALERRRYRLGAARFV